MPKIYLGSLPEPINCKSFTLTLSLNTDMNAEQLARDIKSLDQAHRELDQVVKEPGASVGFKAQVAARYLRAEQGNNNISVECAQQTHKELTRALPRSMGRLDERVKELVDELLKLREDPSLKEIREIVSKALGYSHEAISGTTTAGLVEMLARGCKDMQDHGLLEKLHREFDRAKPRYLGGVIERARRAVDELLKLRQQGAHAAGHIHDLNKQLEALKAEQGEIRRKVAEALGKDALEIRALTTQEIVYMLIYRLGETKQGETNNSRLEEEDRLEIREKLITALGCGRFTSTVAMVDLVLGELQHTRAEAASDTAKNFNASILRLKAKADFEELKQEHQKLSEKHQELHSNYKLLQALSIGQPKGLAPKEKWGVYPIGQGSYRVMRGNEDATPHPVSKGIADAIAAELNAR